MSVAVTVIVAAPSPAGVIVTCVPDTLTVATAVADEDAAYASVSSSGSRNAPATSTVTALPPTRRVRSASRPTATGGWLPAPATTGSAALRVASPPWTTAAT